MATYIKTLKEDNGDITYPQTLASAVLTNGGSDVEAQLATKASAADLVNKITKGAADVQTADIASSAVTEAKIASNAVTTAKIKDANVTAAKLASNAVTTAKIADGAVTAAKLGDTGWITCPYASGYKASTNTAFLQLIRVRIIGNIFYLQGGVSPSSGNFTANAEVVVTTLPTDIASRLTLDKHKRFFISGSSSSAGFGTVNTNGNIYVSPNAAASWTCFNMSMPID